ncbi:hypothetical protein [Brevibacillus fluminis]|uniref:hypothetical protein n=1 Tax=Brevibacillus fluminis TaxID=511487 RepID=UPI001605D667|nr:hypothetical protein [Brevibacillus fluminis]
MVHFVRSRLITRFISVKVIDTFNGSRTARNVDLTLISDVYDAPTRNRTTN